MSDKIEPKTIFENNKSSNGSTVGSDSVVNPTTAQTYNPTPLPSTYSTPSIATAKDSGYTPTRIDSVQPTTGNQYVSNPMRTESLTSSPAINSAPSTTRSSELDAFVADPTIPESIKKPEETLENVMAQVKPQTIGLMVGGILGLILGLIFSSITGNSLVGGYGFVAGIAIGYGAGWLIDRRNAS